MTEKSSQPFSLIRLWRHKESRAVLLQIIIVAAVFAFIAWLALNASRNLDALGQGIDYTFLAQVAGYDITPEQQLIDYTSTDTHARAALVGILNTLLVAVCGIAAATVVGFLVGVMRLSPNFLVNRIASVYVEIFRNVPILLWILLFHGVIINSLPRPRDAISIEDTIFLTNRGFYLPRPVWLEGAGLTLIALIIGIVGSYFYARHARRVQVQTGRILPTLQVSIAAIVLLPLAVFAISGLPVEFEIAEKRGFNFQGGWALKPEFLSLWGALSLYTAAFIAEIVRSGIVAVSHGQTEAAYALGIKRQRTLQLVVIPQALRVIVPPLTNQYLNLTKNSSLAIAVGYMDIVATLGGISLNQTGRAMEAMSLVLVIYLTISLLISSFMNWYNKRIKLVER